MSEENKNNLFSEDLFMMAGDISDMIGEEETTQTPPEDDNTEQDNEFVGQNNEIDDNSEEDNNLDDNQETEENDFEESEDNNPDGEDATSSEENNDDNNDSPSLAPYAKLLVDEGILPNLDLEKFDGTPESLIEAARNEVYNGIDYYKQTLPPEVKKLIEGYEAGVPFDKLLEFNSQNTQYSKIDKDSLVQDEGLQKQILKDYYKRTSRFSEEKIDKLIERTADLGELSEEALSSLDELVEFQSQEEQQAIEQARQQQEALKQQQQEQLNQFNQTLEKTEEIIPGVKINKGLKDKIQKNITTPVAYDDYGNPVNKIGKYRSENPIDFEIKLNYLFEATNGFTNFDVFSKAGKSKAYQELENAAKSLDKRGGAGNNGSRPKGDPEVKDSINHFLNQFGK